MIPDKLFFPTEWSQSGDFIRFDLSFWFMGMMYIKSGKLKGKKSNGTHGTILLIEFEIFTPSIPALTG